MPKTARACIFCGEPAGSGEHGFPDWLNAVFRAQEVGPTDVHFGSVTPTGSHHNTWATKKIASQRIKVVCGACNTGWMSQMEGDTKPILLPMIQGTPTTLTMPDQLAVAAWAVKTAMVLEHTHPSGQRFTEMDRRTVSREKRPPAHVLVTAGAIEGNAGPLQFAFTHGLVQDHGKSIVATVSYYTLQVGVLLLQMVRPEPAELGRDILKSLPTIGRIEVPLYPPVEHFYWPPAVSQTPESFRSFTLREGWLQVDGPVSVEAVNALTHPAIAS